MDEWNRRPLETASSWSARLQGIRLPPTATRIERARLAATRRSARLAVRRAIASERLRQVFQSQPETVTGRPTQAGRTQTTTHEVHQENQNAPAVFQRGTRQIN